MIQYRKWSVWALLNLVIVAAAGILLRYKIAFSLPFIDQKNLLHAHSHFAFSGWVSLALFTSVVAAIEPANTRLPVYSKLFVLAQVAGFGMLLTFPFMGYKAPSIIFSMLSILFSYLFAFVAWKDINRGSLPKQVGHWFRAGLFFYVLSSLGAFNLAWLMATKTGTQPWYIGSVYYFLHFQYNGWFLFAILGLFFYHLEKSGLAVNPKNSRAIFVLLFSSCLPAVLLSALWMRLPGWVHGVAIAAALAQLFALILVWKMILPLWSKLRQSLQQPTQWLWCLSFMAFTLKFVLQSLSAIPRLSYLAFGFRPIVIGYLHLVLLGFVTLFIIGYLVQQQYLQYKTLPAWGKQGLVWFAGGVLLNELLLMTQGIAALNDTGLPVLNYFLLGAAVVMFTGLVLFIAGQWSRRYSI